MIVFILLIITSGCSTLSPSPQVEFGETAFSAQKGQTTLGINGHAAVLAFKGGLGGFGGEISHQVSDDVRVGVQAARATLDTGNTSGGDQTQTDGRLAVRIGEDNDGGSASAFVAGVGGSHQSHVETTYFTGDVGVVGSISGDLFGGYLGCSAALSSPLVQGDDNVVTTAYAGTSGGIALLPGDSIVYVEVTNLYGFGLGHAAFAATMKLGARAGVAMRF